MSDSARCSRIISLTIVFGLLLASMAAAQVRGISYTLSPVAEQIFFGKNAGLERGFLYGGEVGFGFGRFVELNATYVRNGGLTTDFNDVTGVTEETRELLEGVPARTVNMQRYGGKLKLNLPLDNVVPFALLGAGIIRLEPEHLNPTRTIYLGGGAGVQFAVAGRYALALSAQHFAYRYNLGSTFFDDLDLADVGLGPRSFKQTQVNNWAFRAGVQVYVGGRAPGEETELDRALREQLSGGLRGLSLSVEPVVSSLAFHEDLAFRDDQRFGGLYAGLNLGPHIGVRGFYWRALEPEGLDLASLQAYGGEIRFELGVDQSLTPYVTVGGGYMDVLDDYVGRAGSTPGDEPFVLVGAGALLPLSDALALNVGARSVLMGEEGAHNVDDPGQVRSSWMYSGGLTLAFGGRRTSPSRALAAAGDADDASRLREEVRNSEARIDSLARVLERLAPGDGVMADSAATRADPTLRTPEPRMVTLPLPEEGELYVRFGRPGGVSIETTLGEGGFVDAYEYDGGLTSDEIEQIVRTTVREQLAASREAAATQDQVAQIERMLLSRLDAMEDRLQSRLESDLRQVAERAEGNRIVVVDPSVDGVSVERRVGTGAVKPFMGAMFGTPNMGILGARLDTGEPVLGPIELQPEFALGFGAETYAYHLSLDAVYELAFVERMAGRVRPYVGLGAGMLGFNESPDDAPGVQLTFNNRVGADFGGPWGRLFAELATYDLFSYNRIAAGYRFGL